LETEPFLTLKDAAERLNLPYFKLQRAAKRGLIPTHRLLNSRPLVRLSEIEGAMKKYSGEGDQS
jgi:excisionase family DNA binding protein